MKNRIITFSIVLLLAGIFWLVIKLSEEYTIDLVIPVKIDMEGSDIALEGEIPRSLEIKVQGTGWDLIRVKYIKHPIYKIKTKDIKGVNIIKTSTLTNENFLLPSSLKILSVKPEEIKLFTNFAYEKRVKVYPDLSMSFVEGYDIVSPIRVEPESIIIRGSKKILSQIDSIPTKKIELDNLSQDVNIDVLLEDTLSYLITFDVNAVKVNFDVQQIVDKEFEKLPIQIINSPIDKNVICIPSVIDLKLRGGIDLLGSLNNDSIKVIVDFKKFNATSSEGITPEFILPYGVKIIDYYPELFKLIIRE